MFSEGGDADATAAYVSMYQECVKGVGACIHEVFFILSRYVCLYVCMYVCMYPSDVKFL